MRRSIEALNRLWKPDDHSVIGVVYAIATIPLILLIQRLSGWLPSIGWLLILPLWLATRFGGLRWGAVVVLILSYIGWMSDVFIAHLAHTALISDAIVRFACLSIILLVVSGIEQKLESVRRDALMDPLTGLFNRRALGFLSTDAKLHETYSVAMIDLNDFKKLNDKHGHSVGDEALKTLGRVLREGTRSTDFVARVGGDEFLVILSGANHAHGEATLERIAQSFQRQIFGRKWNCDISYGVASSLAKNDTIDDVIARADKAMYQAKRKVKRSSGTAGIATVRRAYVEA